MACLFESARNLETVDAGKLDVEQDELRPQSLHFCDSRFTVGGLPDDLESLRLEQLASNAAEALVIVHDQNCARHAANRGTAAARRHWGEP
jgi:hypothetical protein